jgi:F-type H+-transporting ATPase subunit c
MNVRSINLAALVVVALFCCVAPAMADTWGTPAIGAGFGAGIVMLGAGYGISLIASKAVESMARQPEVAGQINGAMIVSAALIEGATFFALVVCLLALVLK